MGLTDSGIALDVADGVAVVTLDRPPVNALDFAMQDRLHAIADRLGSDDAVRVVVLRSSGAVFSAGADIKQMAATSPAAMRDRARPLQNAFTAVAELPQPVIAVVEGIAYGGGCELALCADFRVCGTGARFALPEINLGLIPGAGGTQRLPRLIGGAQAKLMMLTGRAVDAVRAAELGLADLVTPGGAALESALALAAELADGPVCAVRAVKEAVDGGLAAGDLRTGLLLERELFGGLFTTDDARHGLWSFVRRGPGQARFSAGVRRPDPAGEMVR